MDQLHNEPGQKIIVNYGNHRIDICRYIGVGDYSLRTMVRPCDGSLYWVRWGYNGGEIVELQQNCGNWTESGNKVVADLGMRSFWAPVYNARFRVFYFISDTNNAEDFNLFCFDPERLDICQITKLGYIVEYAFCPNDNKVVLVGRKEKTGKVSNIFELNLSNPGEVNILYTDIEEFRIFPYIRPVIDDQNQRIAFVVKKENSRSKLNLAIFSRITDTVDVVTNNELHRNCLKPLAWRGNTLLIISDEGSEKERVYVLDFNRKEPHLSLLVDNPLRTADGIYDARTDRILIQFRDDKKSYVMVVHPETGVCLQRQESGNFEFWWSDMCHPIGQEGDYAISARIRGERDTLIVRMNSKSTFCTTNSIFNTAFVPSINGFLATPCKMEYVLYPTFDFDEYKQVRKIKAVCFMPKELPIEVNKRAAIVYAHGGPSDETTTSWNPHIQFLTQMGYIVLGANPRGSTGQGKKFQDLNHHDWGGGDYRDYEHGLMYLQRRFGIPYHRIGITGESFGGYMTNWAVTRPNGIFGFGISISSMTDLNISVRESVVASNTINGMGDPQLNQQLYYERSPLHWAKYMDVPLLLIHGSRDCRTATKQSQIFYKKLKKN